LAIIHPIWEILLPKDELGVGADDILVDSIDLGDKTLVTLKDTNNDKDLNVSIGVAAAISA
jgi:hypothetical protein